MTTRNRILSSLAILAVVGLGPSAQAAELTVGFGHVKPKHYVHGHGAHKRWVKKHHYHSPYKRKGYRYYGGHRQPYYFKPHRGAVKHGHHHRRRPTFTIRIGG